MPIYKGIEESGFEEYASLKFNYIEKSVCMLQDKCPSTAWGYLWNSRYCHSFICSVILEG